MATPIASEEMEWQRCWATDYQVVDEVVVAEGVKVTKMKQKKENDNGR